jgi:phosphoribosylformylglycinamidine cyclo-ligase
MAVHRSYLKPIGKLRSYASVHALAHITGGGIVGNTKRVIPKNCTLRIDWESWKRPAIFQLIQKHGNVPEEDMRQTFNLGIGLVIITAKHGVDKVVNELKKLGEVPVVMGEVVKN